jgi:hypothetical protein
MLKQYVVLFESNHYGWIAYFANKQKVNRLLKDESTVYYIFKCVHTKTEQFSIKLNFPLSEYYGCLEINDLTLLDRKFIDQKFIDQKFIDQNINNSYLLIKETPDCEDDSLVVEYVNF